MPHRQSAAPLVYLADLSHTGVRVATEAFPLNIGLVAAWVRRRLGSNVTVRLFKYPDKLLDALRREPPAILGCSNYTWNSNLSTYAVAAAKAIDPAIVTVFGGTNYPFEAADQQAFLAGHPDVDLHMFYEGEESFARLLERYLEAGSRRELFERPLDGCQFLHPETGDLVSGASVERLRELDQIPSPYVTGLLDEFFDGTLTPLMETTRGCPFTCNFCNAGNAYFNRVAAFSVDYVRDEVEYIAPRAARLGISHLTLCDNNFGMLPRDQQIAEIFARSHAEHRWPLQMTAWTGKNSKERVIKATEILGPVLSINMAVQSMSRPVLVNIKRDNIRLDAYKGINEALTRQGRPQEAEIIVPLPGETLESYLTGVRQLMEAEARRITSYTLQLLHGTPYRNDEYLRQHGYVSRWRVVPLDFGLYDGTPVFDCEEVAVSSNTMSFDDYLRIRALALTTELCYNDYTFFELLKYLKENGVSLFDWTLRVVEERHCAPATIQRIYHSFLEETTTELWDSEQDIVAFYSEPGNYQQLVDGTRGGNVLFKYKGLVFGMHLEDWIAHLFGVTRSLLGGHEGWHRQETELAALELYVSSKLVGVLRPAGPHSDIRTPLAYDIPTWVNDQAHRSLSDFRWAAAREYRFYFTDIQNYERRDLISRYGTDTPGIVKTLQRAASLNRLFRQVEVGQA